MSATVHQWLRQCQLTRPGSPSLKVDNCKINSGIPHFPNGSEAHTYPHCDFDDDNSSGSSTSSDVDSSQDDEDDEAHNCVLDSTAWTYGDHVSPMYMQINFDCFDLTPTPA